MVPGDARAPGQSDRKGDLARRLSEVRGRTRWLLGQVPSEFWRRRIHDFYSPIGWHFGHVGRTEEFWACHEAMGWPVDSDRLTFLYHDCPENPKENRVDLPDPDETWRYLERTRAVSLRALEEADLGSAAPLVNDGYAWDFAYQHECQHQETICEMLCLLHRDRGVASSTASPEAAETVSPSPSFVRLAGGTFVMGARAGWAYDNERDAHEVFVPSFELAERAVTVGEWRVFVGAGGYHDPQWWTPEGWAWRRAEDAQCPFYWTDPSGAADYGMAGIRRLSGDDPVQGVSAHEADAFARFSGARLPTEAEWEFAARAGRYPWGDAPPDAGRACFGIGADGPHPAPSRGASPEGVLGLAGGTWEWTASPFAPYPGFRAFPYAGYSADHMQGAHRVCRGGSWATAGDLLRRSFRNWYVPTYRQGFLGVRLAR